MEVFNWWSSKIANPNATAEILPKFSKISFSFPAVSPNCIIQPCNLMVSVHLGIILYGRWVPCTKGFNLVSLGDNHYWEVAMQEFSFSICTCNPHGHQVNDVSVATELSAFSLKFLKTWEVEMLKVLYLCNFWFW